MTRDSTRNLQRVVSVTSNQAFENPVLEKRIDGRTALVLSAGTRHPPTGCAAATRSSRGSLSASSP